MTTSVVGPTLGPNTNADSSLLHERVLLCCGEEPEEFSAAFQAAAPGPLQASYRYRCYQWWKTDRFTAVWSGIGTGCLEPLLWELLGQQVVRRIVLIGTAGRLRESNCRLGQPYLARPAWLSLTALDHLAPEGLEPLLPSAMETDLPQASVVSTDLFYGFSERALQPGFPLQCAHLADEYRRHSAQTDLVDMETAQFYLLCQRFGANHLQRYAALRAAANDVGNGVQQIEQSAAALTACARSAVRLLEA